MQENLAYVTLPLPPDLPILFFAEWCELVVWIAIRYADRCFPPTNPHFSASK
jgi:hypothetical protein